MIRPLVYEERTESSTHFTDQKVYLVFGTRAYEAMSASPSEQGSAWQKRGQKNSMHSTFITSTSRERAGVVLGQVFRHHHCMLYYSAVFREPMMALDTGCSQHIGSLGRNHCVFGQFKTGTTLLQNLLTAPSDWPGSVVTFRAAWKAPVMVAF